MAVVGLPMLSRERPAPPPPIAIDFVAISDQTRVVAPEAPKEQPRSQPQEPQPQYAAADASEDLPSDVAPALEDTAESAPVVKPKPKPQVSENRQLANRITPRAKPKPPSRLKSQRIAALIDRSIKEEREQAERDEEKQEELVEAQEPEQQPDRWQGLRGRLATASIQDALSQKVSACWSFPIGSKDVENMRVTIRIALRPDGALLRRPEIVEAGDMDDGFYRVFVESAQRAVLRCEPYSDVAKQLLESGEQEIDFVFNPQAFAGG